jgi:predicted Zn-dependent protease
MNMRPKTVKRLLVLIGGFLLLVVLSVGFVFFRWHQLDQQMQAKRAQGMASYERGDYPAVLKELGAYLGIPKNQTDAEALFAYAKSRSRVEESDHHEIRESVDLFQRYLSLKPDDLEAQRLLLDLLPQVGKNQDARDLADSILAKHPDDAQALRAKATALLRLRQYKDALAVAQKLNTIAPKDIEGQMITLQTMAQLDEPIEKLLDRTAKLRQANPGDPRFELLEGWVHAWRSKLVQRGSSAAQFKEDIDQAKQWLLKAAAHPVKDASFIKLLAVQMDQIGLYPEVQKLLENAVADNKDPKIRKLLVDRLFQNGRNQQIVDQLKDLDPASQMSGSELLAMKALALFSLNRRDEANQIVDALSKRTKDEVALGWATALRTRYAQTPLDPQAMVVQYQSALVRNPQSAIIRYYLGELYARLSEGDLALQQWGRAMQLAPGWFLPRLMASKVLLNSGRADEAAAQAELAYRIMPGSGPVISNLLVIRFLQQDPSDAAANAKLLDDIRQFQKLAPGEAQTLPVYVTLLSRAGKQTEAADVLRKALAARPKDKPYTEETLLKLAAVSRQCHLGLEQDLFDRALKAYGLTPALASAQAEDLARSGKVKDGLALLHTDAAKGGNGLDWRIAIARYLESTADPAAREAWMALGEDQQNNKNLPLQLMILDAPSLWSAAEAEPGQPEAQATTTRDFLRRTIDRVHTLTSDDAMAWKLGQARWLLGSEDKDKDSARAVVILADILRAAPRMTKARKLMALANENIGQVASAIDQLKLALQTSPNAVDIQLDLGRLLQAQGRPTEARDYLVAAAASEAATTAVKYRAASMLSRQGEQKAAIDILEKLPPANGRDLMLGELYARQGRASDAAKLYSSMNLLKAKTPDAGLLLAVAEFYADQGQMDVARQYLARLNEAKVKPDVRGLMLAGFQERHGTPAQALDAFTTATQAAPDSNAAWVGLAGYNLRTGRLDEALAAADMGIKTVSDPADLSAIKSIATALKAMGNPGELHPLIVALSRQPRHPVAQQAWQILQHGAEQKLPADKTLSALKQLADKNPRFLPLQSVLVTQYAAQGKATDAMNAVARLMDLFPNSPEVAEQAVRVYAASGNWARMLSSAQQWRQRMPAAPVRPDLAIAEAQCFLGNPSAAIKQLTPYLEAAKKDPQHHANVLVDYTRALVLAGRVDEASKILTPLLPTSPAWRAQWLSLASVGRRSVGSASQWIDAAAQYIKPDNQDERLLLAKTWYDVAQASGDKALHQKAIDILSDLAKQPNVKPAALVMLASSAEQLGKTDLAIENYRRALKADTNLPFAQNELAYLLITHDGDVQEAKTLASQAVAASPGTAAYHDTLGHVYLKLGDRTNGILCLQKAMNLDPRNVDTQLALGEALLQDGKTDQAAAIADQLGKLPPDSLKDSQTKQLTALRQRLRNSSVRAEGT